MYHRCIGSTVAVLLMASIIAAPSSGADEEMEIDLQRIPADVLNKLPIHDKTLIDDTQPGQGQAAKRSYWLGIGVEVASDALRAHLPLPEGTGLAILQVMPDSPAAKAGLQVHDVLIEADGVSLKSQPDLVDAVNKARDKKMRLSLFRRGDDITLEATPEIRPGHAIAVDDNPDFAIPRIEGLDGEGRQALQQWLQEMQKQGSGRVRPFNFRFFGPAFKMRADAEVTMPENLKIQIQKSGQEPATIQVQRGDESWEITEDQLDQLPPDVRGHVQPMLGGNVQFEVPDIRSLPGLNQPLDIPGLGERLSPDAFPRLQERLDQMNDRMEQLFDRLDELQQPEEEQ